ncbi:hypothetical protein AB0F72_37850 [Actinoplanes sp. NPDC023936]|uniref:hypothetical protein n=1 Tax=Actinoplanes sp. NPDC023936 TaxID=3154910 RepID=UPI0033E3FA25
MLYDDDRGGSPFEPLDNRQWEPPLVNHDLLGGFDGPERILIALSGDAAEYAFTDDKVFEVTGMPWTREGFDAVVHELAAAGLVAVEDDDEERWLTITDLGEDRAEALIESTPYYGEMYPEL